jgi:hypothetical protein
MAWGRRWCSRSSQPALVPSGSFRSFSRHKDQGAPVARVLAGVLAVSSLALLTLAAVWILVAVVPTGRT